MGAWLAPVSRVLTHASASLRRLDREAGISDHLNQELESGSASVYSSFWEAVHSVTAEHAKGWFSHCGHDGHN